MALSQIFRNITAAIRESLDQRGVNLDTYALLDVASEVNEYVVAYGVEEYDKGYQEGRNAEAARHPKPLATWERELLNDTVVMEFTKEEFVLLHKVIGRHFNGSNQYLMPLWEKFNKMSQEGQSYLPKAGNVVVVSNPTNMLTLDNPAPYHPHHPEDKCWVTCKD